jgi:hypothetical protein
MIGVLDFITSGFFLRYVDIPVFSNEQLVGVAVVI